MRDWLTRGLLAGVLFGAVDNLWLLSRSHNLPGGFVITNQLLAVGIGLMGGVVAALGYRLRRRLPVPDFAAVWVPIAATLVFFRLLGEVVTAARFRDVSPTPFVVLLLVLTLTGAVVAEKVVRRFARTPSPELSFALSTIVLSVCVTGGHFLSKSVLGGYSSASGIVGCGALAAILVAFILFHGRWLPSSSMPRACSPDVLLCVGAGAALAVTGGLWWITKAPEAARAAEREDPAVHAVPHTNIVLITIDTLRADRVSLHGYERSSTPNLDRFAKDAMVFTRAVAPSSWTLPSHASLFTGLLPERHGVDFGPEGGPASPLDDDALTLAEILASESYETAAFVANGAYLHRSFNLSQGFDVYDDALERYVGHQTLLASFRWLSSFAHDRWTKAYRPATSVNRAALAWLDENASRPFLLFLNYMEPHEPYCPPRPWDTRFDGRGYFVRDPSQSVLFGGHRLDEKTREHYEAVYDGEVAYVDFEIGKLFGVLRERELYDSSLIVVTSDHGEFFGEHDLWGHGVGPYDEVHRVPLLIKLPGATSAGVFGEWVQLTDVLPTILDELGIARPPELDGAPLPHDRRAAFISGQPNPTRARFGPRFHLSYRGVYLDSWKLTSFSDGRKELYNLDDDPAETTNLAATKPEWRNVLELRLGRHLQSMGFAEEGFAPEEIDPAVLDRLRSLGYVE